MGAYVANENELADVGRNIYNLIQEIASLTRQISTHITNVTGNWTDAAGNTFGERYKELEASIPDYLAKGEAYASFLDRASKIVGAARRMSETAVNSTQG